MRAFQIAIVSIVLVTFYLAVCRYRTVFSPSIVTRAKLATMFSATPDDVR